MGAYSDDDGESNAGSVYVFSRSGGTWKQETKLTASDGAANDSFGYAVGISSDTVIVGAYLDDDDGDRSGSAYVFARSGDTWTEQAKLTATDASAYHYFGVAVAVSSNTAAVGAWSDDQAATNAGAVYVFTRSEGVWTQQAKLTASDAVFGDSLGYAVAIDNTTIVAGAYMANSDAGADSGAAYVFTHTAEGWSEEGKLTASDAAAGDWFGASVAVSGDTAIVGADRDSDGGDYSGSAYVFTRTGCVWTQQAKLTADDGAASDHFGGSVSVSGNTAICGAWGDGDGGPGSGSVYVFSRAGEAWTQEAKLGASDALGGDAFGYAVGISGDQAIVGALHNDDAGDESGSAYVLELGTPPATATPTPTPTSLATATPTPTPISQPTDTPTATTDLPQFQEEQVLSVVSDGRFYAVCYNLNDGSTEDWADAYGSGSLSASLVSGNWYGAYLYDYGASAYVEGAYVYRQDLP